MSKFVFDFTLDIWMQCVEIEAKNYEEAKEKLLNMSVDEILEEGYLKDYDLKQIDCEEKEK